MSSDKLPGCLAQMLRILADELETNKKLAKRLSATWQDHMGHSSPVAAAPAKKKKAASQVPPALDPFVAFFEGGSVGLIKALETVEVKECKAIISHYALDPSRSYVRWRKKERLINFIVQRVKAVANKGEVFKE